MDNDDEDFLFDGPLSVYERNDDETSIPEVFSAASIALDARASSSLDWQKAEASAHALSTQGKQLLFDLQLGIFDAESKPLSHLGQFQARAFAIAHFREHLWPQFARSTLGAILCRYTPTSLEDLVAHTDYLELLAAELPAPCQPFLLLDATHIQDVFEFITLFRPDRISRFRLAIKQAPLHIGCATWQEGKGSGGYIGRNPLYKEQAPPKTAILIPPIEEPLFENITELVHQYPDCKIIPEAMLTMEWDNLEQIIVPYTVHSITTRRALGGFLAAGGRVDEKAKDL
jgi:hypothetical protein